MGVLGKALRLTDVRLPLVRMQYVRGLVVLGFCVAAAGCSVPGVGPDQGLGTGNVTEANEVASQDAVTAETIATAPTQASEPQLEQLLSASAGQPGISVERGANRSRYRIQVEGSEPVYDVKVINDPARVVIDLLGQPGKKNSSIATPSDEIIKGIRLGAHQDRTRLVFDVQDGIPASEFSHEIDVENGQLVVSFDRTSGDAIPQIDATKIDSARAEETETEVVASAAPVAALPDAAPIAETEVAQAEDSSVVAAVETPAAEDTRVSLDAVTFEKSVNDSGQIIVKLSDATAYDLHRTAPSEYTLTVAGAEAAARATAPQISPKGFPGIRSVRTSQNGDSVVLRMFVDPGVELRAIPSDPNIVVRAEVTNVALMPEARAQLESGDQPQVKAESAPVDKETAARENPTGKIASSDGSKDYTGRLISLDLQDTDIDNALRIIAEVSNLNIIASDDVTGKVTLRLIDVPWDQALDVILKTNGLDQVTEGNVIRIAPIDKLRQEREALQQLKKAQQQLEDLSVSYKRVSYARATDMKEQVESVLTERGTVTVDERTNQLIIKDTKLGQKASSELISKLDLRTPQVLLETQIVESGRSILRDLGFQWNFSYAQSPATGNSTGLNFPNSVLIGGANEGNLVSFPANIAADAGSAVSAILESADGSRSLSARLSALEQERKVKVVSRPQVATVNNKEAQISSVETFRVRTPSAGTAISTGSGAQASGGANNAFEEIKVGIELKVTPQASPDYFVLLDIWAKSSTLGPSPQVDAIPSTLDREATSTVLVKSGQTFALGGVYRLDDSDSVSGVPFLKDIPFLGHAFRNTLVDKQDEELIFFITPHIVEGSFDPSLM